MNHRPFEDWLLNEQPITPEEKRKLQIHLQECDHCSALAEINLELRSVKMAAPAPGFTRRFRVRLETQRVRERRNRLVGVSMLAFSGLVLAAWFTVPLLLRFLGSPAEWIAAGTSFLLTLVAMAEAIGDIGAILLRVLPGFVPPFAWLMIASLVSGVGLLWAMSIWRFTRVPRGV
jgi:hypothetical protein